MDPLTLALLSGGLQFGSDYFAGRTAKKQRKREKKRLSRAISATESIQGKGLQQQEALARQGTQQQLAGYDAAKREAQRLGQSSKQGLLDRESQLGATLSQGLTNRGLGSTTVGGNIQRGISADTQRGMMGINEGLAEMFGQLALGRSGVEAQGTQRLSDLSGQRSDLQSQLSQMGFLGGRTLGNFQMDQSVPQSFGSQLMNAGNAGLGAFIGAGGGQGGGGFDQNAQLMQMLQQLFEGGQGHQLLQGPMQASGRY